MTKMPENSDLEERLREIVEKSKEKYAQEITSQMPSNISKTMPKRITPSDDLESTLKEVNSHILLSKGDYNIKFNIVIKPEGTLEIEPGTNLYLCCFSVILSLGTLKAIGKPDQYIQFKADYSSWGNITFWGKSSSHSILDYCLIRQGVGSRELTLADSRKEEIKFQAGGGAIIYNSDLTMSHSIISNNRANQGGGLFLYYSNPKLIGNNIHSNNAVFGGGIYCYCSNPELRENTIVKNQAEQGGGLFLFKSNPIHENNTIENNIPNNMVNEK